MPEIQYFTVSITLTTRSGINTSDGPSAAITKALNELKIPAALKITDVHAVNQR